MRGRAGRTGADRTRRAGASPHLARRPGGARTGGPPGPQAFAAAAARAAPVPGGVMIGERSASRPGPFRSRTSAIDRPLTRPLTTVVIRLLNCEDQWTRHAKAVLNPPSNEPVDATPMFTPPTTCHGGSGDTRTG